MFTGGPVTNQVWLFALKTESCIINCCVACISAKKISTSTPSVSSWLIFICVELICIALFHSRNDRPGSPLVAVVFAKNGKYVDEFPCSPVGPVSPVGPIDPWGPCKPIGPVGPVGPVGPIGPCGPIPPVLPSGPMGPVSPVGPVAPVGPVGPVTVDGAPMGPVGPVGPNAPVGPVGPGTIDADPWGPVDPVAPVGPVGPMGPVAPVGPPRSAISCTCVCFVTPFWTTTVSSSPVNGVEATPNCDIERSAITVSYN